MYTAIGMYPQHKIHPVLSLTIRKPKIRIYSFEDFSQEF